MSRVVGHALYLVLIIFTVISVGAIFSTFSVGINASDPETLGSMGETFGPWLIPVGLF